jgi:hypothetical protein
VHVACRVCAKPDPLTREATDFFITGLGLARTWKRCTRMSARNTKTAQDPWPAKRRKGQTPLPPLPRISFSLNRGSTWVLSGRRNEYSAPLLITSPIYLDEIPCKLNIPLSVSLSHALIRSTLLGRFVYTAYPLSSWHAAYRVLDSVFERGPQFDV